MSKQQYNSQNESRESLGDFRPSERLLRNIGVGETIVYGCHRSSYELAEEVLAAILRPFFSLLLLVALCRLVPHAIIDGMLLGLWMVYILVMLYQLWIEYLKYQGEEFVETKNAKGEPYRFVKVVARGDSPILALWRVDCYADLIVKITLIPTQSWWMSYIRIVNITVKTTTEGMNITATHVPDELYRTLLDLGAQA